MTSTRDRALLPNGVTCVMTSTAHAQRAGPSFRVLLVLFASCVGGISVAAACPSGCTCASADTLTSCATSAASGSILYAPCSVACCAGSCAVTVVLPQGLEHPQDRPDHVHIERCFRQSDISAHSVRAWHGTFALYIRFVARGGRGSRRVASHVERPPQEIARFRHCIHIGRIQWPDILDAPVCGGAGRVLLCAAGCGAWRPQFASRRP